MSKGAAEEQIVSQVNSYFGSEGSKVVRFLLDNVKQPSAGWTASLIGIATLIFGASGVFRELRSALNKIWEVKPQTSSGVRGMVRDRILSFGMVLGIGFLLIIAMLLSAGMTAMGRFYGPLLPMHGIALGILNFFISFLGVAVPFGLIFKFIPAVPIPWRDVRPGTLITALLFTVGKTLMGRYMGRVSASPYNVAGSLIFITFWIYYSAQIFLFGAEFTHIYALYRSSDTLDEEDCAGR
jgi:membrane protein